MKSVALLGMADTVWQYEDKFDEAWSLNLAYQSEDFPPCTRWFEMHGLRELIMTAQTNDKFKDHLLWLTKEHDFPVYMQENYERFPSSVKYPLEKVSNYPVHRPGAKDYYTSTFPFMVALAIHEGFDEIHVYGIEAGTETEYAYQKAATEFWLGVAVARGVKVVLQENSALVNAAIYGYEGGQMLDNETVKNHLKSYREQLKFWQGEWQKSVERVKENPSPENMELMKDREQFMFISDGAVRVQSLHVDNLKEPPSLEEALNAYQANSREKP